MNDQLTAQVIVEFSCPFCGKLAGAVKPHGVVHALPVCQKFLDEDPSGFLYAVNERLGYHVRNLH